ncbi:MAG: hypothetical protein ACXADY_19375 [Candidatus Hodarchaeales archaeon]
MALQQSYFLSKFFFFWFFLIDIVGLNVLPQISLFTIAILLFPMIWLVYIIFALIFPLFPTKSFLRRGIFYGGLLSIIFFGGSGILEYTIIGMSQWAVIGFAIGMFLGMDYSGATPISKPTEIDREYPTMIILLGVCIILLLVLTVIGLVLGG